VQAELQVKTGSPAIGPPQPAPHVPASTVPPPAQRTAMDRQYARPRSFNGLPPQQRAAPSSARSMHARRDGSFSAIMPQGQPTPSSHASSPGALSTESPGAGPQNVMTSPASTGPNHGLGQQQFRSTQTAHAPRYRYQMQNPPQQQPSSVMPQQHHVSSIMSSSAAGHSQMGATAGPGAAAYPSPFSKHIEPLGKSPRPPLYTELCSS